MDADLQRRLLRLDTGAVSDALDQLGTVAQPTGFDRRGSVPASPAPLSP